MNKYFDHYEFKRAMELSYNNPEAALFAFQKYITKYPKDYSAYPYYINVLIFLGDFEKAEEVLSNVIQLKDDDLEYNELYYKVSHFNYNVLYNKIKLLSYQNKYQELYDFCKTHVKELRDAEINLSRIIHYCEKKLGILKFGLRENYSYFYRQTADYHEDDFIDHMVYHTVSQCEDMDISKDNVFDASIDILKLIGVVKENIDFKNRLFSGFCEDLYFFKYYGCGKIENKTVDYFRVVCTHDTKDIITMYPSYEGEYLPHIDIGYLMIDKPKTKTLSQIDKFNQRYKK